MATDENTPGVGNSTCRGSDAGTQALVKLEHDEDPRMNKSQIVLASKVELTFGVLP